MDDHQALGILTWLAMISRTHERLPSGDFQQQVRQALQTKRVHLVMRQGQPHAWLAWRVLSADALRQHLQSLGHRAEVDDHDHWWLDFWVRPYGCDATLTQAVIGGLRRIHAAMPLGMTAPERVSWHDPSDDRLHLNLPPHQLTGR